MLEKIWTDFLWVLVNFSIVNIMTIGAITTTFREWTHKHLRTSLFYCPMCFSFWTALLLSLVWHSPTGFWLWDSFLGSITAWAMYVFLQPRQENY